MILILSEPDDLHATHVAERLRARRHPHALLPTSKFPTRVAISARSQDAAGGGIRLLDADCSAPIRLSDVGVLWFRRPGPPEPDQGLCSTAARACAREHGATFLADLWATLPCAKFPGSQDAIRSASRKLRQLHVARDLGFEVPPTLVTNDPDDALDFYREHGGDVVTKPIRSTLQDQETRHLMRWTEPITHRCIGYLPSIRHAPIILQARVPKLHELRVTIVGTSPFTAAIDSQGTRRTQLDWRRYSVGTRHWAERLPADVADRCVRMLRCLDIRFGAFDFIVTPDRRIVFIELNPNGQWLWIEHLTGLPIGDAICDQLIADDGRALPAPSAAHGYGVSSTP